MMMKPTERFSDRADNYVKYRPHYPGAIIPWLEAHAGLTTETVVADIGSGTGISSLLFLEKGNQVYAVEPNAAMQEQAVAALSRYPGFVSVTGTAEHTTLPDESIDLLIAGQAFHWFDAGAARTEFRRIGRSGAQVALIWNERLTTAPFEKAYDLLIQQYGTDYRQVNHRNIDPGKIAAFFDPYDYTLQPFSQVQIFDFEGLKGRLFSSSYMPGPAHPSYPAIIRDLQDLFEKYKQQGMVTFHYETKVYLGQIKA